MKLLVFDKTDRVLSMAWRSGAQLYRRLGRVDAAVGVASWAEAFAWIASHAAPIDELQYWGHGTWGAALVAGSDVWTAAPGATLQRDLDRFRDQLAPEALIWFRTCETFGARAGIDFAERLADRMNARVAGHTHVIGFHQSGLHAVAPGSAADWSDTEGVATGTPEAPQRARRSAPWRANTITCFANQIPADWFSTGCRGAARG
ncbi:MAG: hypothetical protein ABI591_25975 [Kofleriaceae bacterium]